jgi:hypothetical protein
MRVDRLRAFVVGLGLGVGVPVGLGVAGGVTVAEAVGEGVADAEGVGVGVGVKTWHTPSKTIVSIRHLPVPEPPRSEAMRNLSSTVRPVTLAPKYTAVLM